MNLLTQIFYTISTVLLVPTELGLIASLCCVLWLIGATCREAIRRRANANARRTLERALEPNQTFDLIQFLREDGNVGNGVKQGDFALVALQKLAANELNDDAFLNKFVDDLENGARERCERTERLVKLGPTLGLMGTLIPLGPALLGLAQGNLETLASNLVVAFSTTVVGLTVGLGASWITTTRKRWARRDFALINYVLARLETRRNNENNDKEGSVQ